MSTIENMLFLTLGWLFGLLSPAIVEAVKNRYRKAKMMASINTELGSLQYRLAFLVFCLCPDIDQFDRKLLEWLVQVAGDYEGIHDTRGLHQVAQNLLKLEDPQIEAEGDKRRSKAGVAKRLRKYDLPFLDYAIPYLGLFSSETRESLLEIKTQLRILQSHIDDSREFFLMTFNPEIVDRNANSLRSNIRKCYESIVVAARYIVNLIQTMDLK